MKNTCQTNNTCQSWRTSSYVTVDYTTIRNPKISGLAKALWTCGLSYPEGWVFHFSHLATNFKESKARLYKAFNELIDAGLAARFPYKVLSLTSNKWVFGGNEMIFFDEPQTKEQMHGVLQYFQKKFENRVFHNAQNEHAVDVPLVSNINSNKDGIGNICAPQNGAPTPHADSSSDDEAIESVQKPGSVTLSDPPRRNKPPPTPSLRPPDKKERLPQHPRAEEFKKIFNTHLIGVSDKDHEVLVARYGQAVILRAYDLLGDWKLSKAETEPGVLKKHTDFHRLKKWVIKEILDNFEKGISLKPSGHQYEENKAMADKIEKEFPQAISQGFIVKGYNYIEFVFGMRSERIKFDEYGFKDRVINNLRKLNIIWKEK